MTTNQPIRNQKSMNDERMENGQTTPAASSADEEVSGVIIRDATEEDGDALFNLYLEALREHPDAFAADHRQTAGDRLIWVRRLRRNLEEGTGTICLAAHGETLVGMSGVYRRSLARMRHVATIWGMYVRPAWRSQGLGSRLLQANVEWAQENGVRMVRLAVVAGNTAAIRCYAENGFVVYGVEPEALRYGDKYYDELLMARRLE